MRIVIAEDEPKSREGLIRLIRRFTDYEIAGVAENGEEGYRMVEKEKPDLVLSDIKMPVLDGLGMLQKIKEADIEVQAVLLTGYSEFEYARSAIQYHVSQYLLKPASKDQVIAAVKEVCEKIVTSKSNTRIKESELAFLKVGLRMLNFCPIPTNIPTKDWPKP